LSIIIPNKWNVIPKEPKKPMLTSGIARDEPTKEFGFALKAL